MIAVQPGVLGNQKDKMVSAFRFVEGRKAAFPRKCFRFPICRWKESKFSKVFPLPVCRQKESSDAQIDGQENSPPKKMKNGFLNNTQLLQKYVHGICCNLAIAAGSHEEQEQLDKQKSKI